MAKKTYLDFSLFDEVGDAMDLFGNLIRNSFEYDSFAGKDEFAAIVITPPVPMDVNQIDVFLPNKKDADPTRSDDRSFFQKTVDVLDDLVDTDEEQQIARLSSMVEDKIPKFTFKARIIGPNSPHQFLPDPCNQQVLRDLKQQQNAQDIFDMHTTVIAIGATEKPSLGDVVSIKLEGGSFSYNLQTATFVRLISSEDQTIRNLLGSQKNECKTGLNNLFAGGFNGATLEGGKPIRDLSRLEPTFKQKIDNLIKALKKQGFKPYINETFRTPERQAFLFSIKATKIETGGMHEKGLAVDIIDGRPHPDKKKLIVGWGSYESDANKKGKEPTPGDIKATQMANEFFTALGVEASKQGLVWGGSWKTFIDKPHVEESRA